MEEIKKQYDIKILQESILKGSSEDEDLSTDFEGCVGVYQKIRM
jgi:hypothetical protein